MELEDIFEIEPAEEIPTEIPCQFITGSAGTGKTFSMKKKISEDPGYGVLAATTGIAAINLGTVTINSLLKFFDTESMSNRLDNIVRIIHDLAETKRRIIVDEVSMMDARQLDLLFLAVTKVNEYADMKNPFGITLLGDFCQLPPVKADFAFKADCWPSFDKNTTRLEKIWRQDNLQFLEAINAARRGDGPESARILQELGVEFSASFDKGFEGTTIIAKNDQVDLYNGSKLIEVRSPLKGLKSETWGDQLPEWKKNIPEMLKLKVGAYCMILDNDSEFEYVNGDCGIIKNITDSYVEIELARNGHNVLIRPIVRNATISEKAGKDRDLDAKSVPNVDYKLRLAPWGRVSYNYQDEKFNIGGIRFFPLRLAWATTCHKSQGLSLNKVQIDARDQFFGSPGLAYVALSRARQPEGLRIVGTAGKWAERVRLDERVRRFL